MGTIYCPECQKEISEYAEACPNCGFPSRRFLDEHKISDVENNKAFICPKCGNIHFGKKIWATSPHVKCEFCGTVVCEMSEPANEIFHEYCNISSAEWEKKIISYANIYGDNSFDIVSYNNRENKIHEIFEKRIHQSTSNQPNTPHCPVCNSTNIEKISLGKKAKGSLLFGFLSSDVRKQMHCMDCGYKF